MTQINIVCDSGCDTCTTEIFTLNNEFVSPTPDIKWVITSWPKCSSRCDPSHITLDLRSLVIGLGLQLEESFLTRLSTRRFNIIWEFTTPLRYYPYSAWRVAWSCGFRKEDTNHFLTSYPLYSKLKKRYAY